jgi:addiction module HigA family antidote
MLSILENIKGVHPGKWIAHTIKKQDFSQRQLAFKLGEHPQTLNAIIRGSRSMNTALSLKIEKVLGFEEGLLMTLQVYFDIEQSKKAQQKKPDFSVLNKSTFWDTDINTIDWQKMKRAVIQRVFTYGTHKEQEEIKRFYGEDTVTNLLNSLPVNIRR